MASRKPKPIASCRQLSLDDLDGIVGGARKDNDPQSQSGPAQAAFDATWLLNVVVLTEAQVLAIPPAVTRDNRRGRAARALAIIGELGR